MRKKDGSTRVRARVVHSAMLLACFSGGALGLTQAANAQTAPLEEYEVVQGLDSGPLARPIDPMNPGGLEEVIYSATLSAPGAGWVRVGFRDLASGGTDLPDTMRLRITSLHDHHSQHLNTITIAQWRHASAYFNGNAVRVEVLARQGEGIGRVVIDKLIAGSGFTVGGDSICGPTDDRVLSSDPRAARLRSVGCTAWLIDDCARCFLTAGHCSGSATVAEFNVPLSTTSGSLVFSAPRDQYSVDAASMQSNGGQGIGNDWAYFGAFPNTETGLTPGQAQGQWYRLAAAAPTETGDIRITGYGTTGGTGAPLAWTQVQKTHTGPFVAKSGFGISYQTDTTGGNSGSPVIDETTGLAIGIHTHAGCSTTAGNNGTAIDRPELQAALANPRGVCCPPIRGIEIAVPQIDLFDPGQPFAFEVTIVEIDGPLDPGSAELFFAVDGGAFQAAALTPLGGDRFEAVLPATDCGQTVAYYVRATSDGRETIEPFGAPASAFEALAATAIVTNADNDFETADGWTVQNTDLIDGGWETGVPDGFRGVPTSDADGSGRAFVTGAVRGADLDGGPTTLLSPLYDLARAPANSVLSYARWFTNDDQQAGIADPDRLVVQVTDNDGADWVTLESVDNEMGGREWRTMAWTLADHIDLTAQVRVRFTVADRPNDSVTEAAIDAFRIEGLECGACRADLDGDGDLTLFDFLAFQNAFASGDPAADFDGDGELTLFDFLAFQNEFAAGCP